MKILRRYYLPLTFVKINIFISICNIVCHLHLLSYPQDTRVIPPVTDSNAFFMLVKYVVLKVP